MGVSVALATVAYAQETTVPASAPVRMLTAEAARADVALMRRALETIHPGLYRYTSRDAMDRAFSNLSRSLEGPITDAELYRRVSLTLALIRCTHTKADQTEAMEAWRTGNPSHLPFRFRIVEGHMLVVASDPNQVVLPRGAEILLINGRRVSDLIETLGAYVPVDGATTWSRASYLADDGDLMGADFDHFYPYVFGFPAEFTLTVRDRAGASRRTIRLSPINFRNWVRLDNDGVGFRENFSEATEWRMLDADIGYLSVRTFVNYRNPTDAAALYQRALRELEAAGARSLIVDLRENGGGSNDAALALVDALAGQPYTYQRAVRLRAVRYGDLPNFISTWGNRDALFNPPMDSFIPTVDGRYDLRPELAPDILLPRYPTPDAFQGPVTVLIGPANASGATMAIAKLRDMGRVRLVGARSGGSAEGPTAGTIFNVTLANSGIVIRVPLALNLMDVRAPQPSGGISPDIEVRETVVDFRSGFDRTLAVAIEFHR
ncbi:MAG: hypothetical protein DCF16_13925 [Alphaproteobacteria bacterium]|nr:MAG: hypothetical protein DCF16_13925 [Alphaproteobacteria bacterium]